MTFKASGLIFQNKMITKDAFGKFRRPFLQIRIPPSSMRLKDFATHTNRAKRVLWNVTHLMFQRCSYLTKHAILRIWIRCARFAQHFTSTRIISRLFAGNWFSWFFMSGNHNRVDTWWLLGNPNISDCVQCSRSRKSHRKSARHRFVRDDRNITLDI